ncbi:hypothetical protein CPB83DRAFT_772248, partial [Crepidotus variabilis]
PYSLNPSRCGHTFCGLCILGWFFSRLHRHCGTWHESFGCPMCRSPLIITPERIPRLQLTFPFVPNRIAASVIESLVAKNTTESDLTDASSQNLGLPAWREDGRMRKDWSKKDRQVDCREEMEYLLSRWTTMQPQDFIAMKVKLGV